MTRHASFVSDSGIWGRLLAFVEQWPAHWLACEKGQSLPSPGPGGVQPVAEQMAQHNTEEGSVQIMG